jgi:hypothetical protein
MLVCQISIFVAALINFFFNPYGLQVGDSVAYAFGGQQNFDLLSFTGHSLRNWPVVLINLVLSNSLLQILAQSLFSAFSWSFLIFQYCRSNLLRKKEFAIFTALLFMTSQNLTWNSTQLAESYSISFVVLLLALSIKLTSNKSGISAFILILGAYLWAMIHGRNFSTLVVFTTIFSFAFLYKHNFRNLNLRLTFRRFALLITALVLLMHVLTVSNNQSNQEYETGLGYKALAYTYTFASQPEAAKVRSGLIEVTEMKCLTLDGSADLYKLTDEMKTTCKSANLWLNEKFLGWYGKFLLENPVTAIKMAVGGLLYGNQPPVLYGATLSILPLPIENVFFGNSTSNLVDSSLNASLPLDSKVNAPLLLWIILLVFFILFRLISRSKHLSVNHSGLFSLIAISSILSAFLAVLVCPAEYFKLTIQMQMLFFLSTFIVILNTFRVKGTIDA